MISNLAISLVAFSDDTEKMAVKGLKDVIEAEIGICIGTKFHTQLRHLILERVCMCWGVGEGEGETENKNKTKIHTNKP